MRIISDTADWCRLIGNFSLNAQNDAWLNLIAKPLGIIKDIPVDVVHDRFDHRQ